MDSTQGCGKDKIFYSDSITKPSRVSLIEESIMAHYLAEPLTAPAIKHIAGKGLENPSSLTTAETQKLAASVLAHIEPRK